MTDSTDVRIDIPTFHVVGSSDPFIHGGITLYSMCDENTSTLFDHGKGHTVPRDGRTVAELAEGLGYLWSNESTTNQNAICV